MRPETGRPVLGTQWPQNIISAADWRIVQRVAPPDDWVDNKPSMLFACSHPDGTAVFFVSLRSDMSTASVTYSHEENPRPT